MVLFNLPKVQAPPPGPSPSRLQEMKRQLDKEKQVRNLGIEEHGRCREGEDAGGI